MELTPAERMSTQVDRAANRLVCGLAGLFLFIAGCDSPPQTIHIVAQDFRFTPADVRLSAGRWIRLVIANEGRERHEFRSRLLTMPTGAAEGRPGSLPVLPNQKAEAVLQTVPGVYPFYCAIHGHAGMGGTIIVE